MACTSGCQTPGAHSSYGQCLRAKRVAVEGLETVGTAGSRDANKRMLRENAAYRAARAEGLKPANPSFEAVDRARRAADIAGAPVKTYS